MSTTWGWGFAPSQVLTKRMCRGALVMKKAQIALGIALGAGLGAAVGVIAGNIGLWLGLGIAIGILIGNRSGRNACMECANAHEAHGTGEDPPSLARPDSRGRLSPHVQG